MNQGKWADWRIKALHEMQMDDSGQTFQCPKCHKDLKLNSTTGKYSCSCGWKEKEPEWESNLGEHHNAEFPPRILNMTVSQLLDNLEVHNKELYDAIEDYIGTELGTPSPTTTLEESFYHLNSEAKIGLAIREMRKNLSLVEKRFVRENELSEINDVQVENWVKAYKSLKKVDERMHSLLKSMRGK